MEVLFVVLMVESVYEWNSHCILFDGLMVESVFVGLMVESVFEWNSHCILFMGLMVESVFERN